ncbi:MAG: hypothetical protein JSU92_08365 [Deltaproteobacteria bacterium]|nr:MAG: hypothetical protein JSU92_08365 [Deltaproteobacteria bacterium]
MAKRDKKISSGETPFNPMNPVYFMHTTDISQEERDLALETLEEILYLAGVGDEIPIVDYGVWREHNYIDENGRLVPHKSVDWYINGWYNSQRNQVDVDAAMTQVIYDPLIGIQPHYDVILTAQDLYTRDTSFVVGVAYPRIGSIVSVNRLRAISDGKMQKEAKKQELYHEVGHVFGLPNEGRGSDIDYSLGAHCTNLCSVRQGVRIPDDWVSFVDDRKKAGKVYCDSCITDLKGYFAKFKKPEKPGLPH